MVNRHTVEDPHRDPAEIPEENVEQRESQLSVFEWYCPDCADWLGWPENPTHAAVVCADPAACSHPHRAGACGHVLCSACEALADSHEWVLKGDQAGRMAQGIFEGGGDIEMTFRKALLEDLKQVTEGESVEEVLEERQDLFKAYVEAVGGDSADN